MSYKLTQAEYKRLKTRLTFRENRLKKAQQKVREARMDPPTRENRDLLIAEANQLLNEATYAIAIFEAKGFPDAWSRWERARGDADAQIRRLGGTVPA